MATVHFTSHLQQFATCDAVTVSPGLLSDALSQALEGNNRLRSYVFDDQNRLRRHVMVFIDGDAITDRLHLSDPVGEESEVYVMQALSGG